ncbi:MAG: ATP-binding protein [Oscillospiraceae bacterium]|jgi:anti-sigma regulatory factor (Ser/Thr protein kinase)|nr:ATP-binding protein [Oscillospiraceae bacterium]
MSVLQLHYDVPGDDFTRAGEASSAIKNKLKQMGIAPDAIRNVAIATYEGEINMVIHANGGTIDVTIDADSVSLVLRDTGAGIPDVELAMREGYTTAKEEIRALGFGAGMGLPNMKKYTDEFELKSEVGKGTEVRMKVFLKK